MSFYPPCTSPTPHLSPAPMPGIPTAAWPPRGFINRKRGVNAQLLRRLKRLVEDESAALDHVAVIPILVNIGMAANSSARRYG